MPSVSITWHTLKDGHKICPICQDIDGAKWTFNDVVPDSLVHPSHGEVWNVVTGSLAHEAKGIKTFSQCQCSIEPQFELKDLLEKVKKLRDAVKATLEAPTEEVEV